MHRKRRCGICIYTENEPLLSHKLKKNETLPFATTWMDLGGIILSEKSRTKLTYDFTYMWIKTKMNKCNKTETESQT